MNESIKNGTFLKQLILPFAILLFVFGGLRVFSMLSAFVRGAWGEGFFVSCLIDLTHAAADVVLGCIALMATKPAGKNTAQQMWFVPAACYAAGTVISWLYDIVNGYLKNLFELSRFLDIVISFGLRIVPSVLSIVALLLVGGWLAGLVSEVCEEKNL